MSNDQVIQMILQRIDAQDKGNSNRDRKIDKMDDLITNILVSIGKFQVKTAMITGIFSTIGGTLAVLLLKYVFKF